MNETVTQQIDEVKKDMCEQYCRWPIAYKRDYKDSEQAFERCLKDKCGDCPLNRL